MSNDKETPSPSAGGKLVERIRAVDKRYGEIDELGEFNTIRRLLREAAARDRAPIADSGRGGD